MDFDVYDPMTKKMRKIDQSDVISRTYDRNNQELLLIKADPHGEFPNDLIIYVNTSDGQGAFQFDPDALTAISFTISSHNLSHAFKELAETVQDGMKMVEEMSQDKEGNV